jgi:hypothetical protein
VRPYLRQLREVAPEVALIPFPSIYQRPWEYYLSKGRAFVARANIAGGAGQPSKLHIFNRDMGTDTARALLLYSVKVIPAALTDFIFRVATAELATLILSQNLRRDSATAANGRVTTSNNIGAGGGAIIEEVLAVAANASGELLSSAGDNPKMIFAPGAGLAVETVTVNITVEAVFRWAEPDLADEYPVL